MMKLCSFRNTFVLAEMYLRTLTNLFPSLHSLVCSNCVFSRKKLFELRGLTAFCRALAAGTRCCYSAEDGQLMHAGDNKHGSISARFHPWGQPPYIAGPR